MTLRREILERADRMMYDQLYFDYSEFDEEDIGWIATEFDVGEKYVLRVLGLHERVQREKR